MHDEMLTLFDDCITRMLQLRAHLGAARRVHPGERHATVVSAIEVAAHFATEATRAVTPVTSPVPARPVTSPVLARPVTPIPPKASAPAPAGSSVSVPPESSVPVPSATPVPVRPATSVPVRPATSVPVRPGVSVAISSESSVLVSSGVSGLVAVGSFALPSAAQPTPANVPPVIPGEPPARPRSTVARLESGADLTPMLTPAP